ncbi:MAG: PorV/PorQ family protein [Gemmatimonadaceae bacterium]|nr:PorV/PorQ family protein [Gemmatimonadaceae bacterium]MDQ3516937.1 PorV/PorQ family protein [Gemmatimonadota bacterium]
MKKLGTIGFGLLMMGAAWHTAYGQEPGPGGLIPTPDNPPTRQGTRGASFLHLGIGARGNAMAGAVGSSETGPSAWYWNPAGAAASDGFSLAAGRQNLYDDFDIGQTYAAASLPVLGGVVGVSFNTLNSGDIDRTTEVNPLGDARAGRSFDWSSSAVSLGYARRLTDRLAVGGQGKYITEGISDANTSWISFDVGTQFKTGIYGLVLGGALQHIGGTARVKGSLISRQIDPEDNSLNRQNTRTDLFTRETELPTEFRFSVGEDFFGDAESLFGGAGSRHSFTAEAAVNDAVDLAPQLGIGAEYSFRKLFYLRAGKRFFNDDRSTGSSAEYGLSGGFGLRIPVSSRRISFDYSYTSVGDLQNIQVFSFEFGQ